MDLQRQQRISEGAKQVTTQPQGTPPVQSGFQRIPAIVRSVDTANFKMKWQAIRYKDTPPKKNEFERFGDERDGYPLEGLDIGVYSSMVVAGEFVAGSPLVFAYRRDGVWILEPAAAQSDSDIAMVYNAPSNNDRYIDVVRVKLVASSTPGALTLAYADVNAQGQPRIERVRGWESSNSEFWSRWASPGGLNQPSTAYCKLETIRGIVTAIPIWLDETFVPPTGVSRGGCQ